MSDHDHDSVTMSAEPSSVPHSEQAPLPRGADTGKPKVGDPGSAVKPKRRPPEAGPSQEDRGPAPKYDLHTRILDTRLVGGELQLVLGLGKNQGVTEDMDGYVVLETGAHKQFKITRAEADRCMAGRLHEFFNAPELQRNHGVVINPKEDSAK